MVNYYFVEHHVKDKEAFYGGRFGALLEETKGKCSDDIKALPVYKTYQPLLSCSSVDRNLTFCIWQAPDDQTFADTEKLITDFVGPAVENKLYKMESSCGVEGVLTADRYFQDLVVWADGGARSGYSSDVDMYYVHHRITNKTAWDTWLVEGFAKVAQLTAPDHDGIKACFDMPLGFDCVTYMNLGEETAGCIWTCPNGTSADEIKSAMDKFTLGNADNSVYLVDQDLSLSICNFSIKEYDEHVVSAAHMLIKQGVSSEGHEATAKLKSQEMNTQ